jgi:SAM-dependent methyltransferase
MHSRRAFLHDLLASYEPLPSEVDKGEQYLPIAGFSYPALHHRRIHRALERFEEHRAEARRILDVGVYPGSLPRLLHRHVGKDLEIAGAGLSFDAAFRENMAREGVTLHEVELDPPPRVSESALKHATRMHVPDGTFDFVFMTEVIEHLVWPLNALAELRRVLRPGGRLLLTTNNAARFGGLLQQIVGRSAQEPIRQSHIFTPPENEWRGHVRLYTMDELAIMLEHVGFRVVYREWYTGGFSEFLRMSPARRLWHQVRRIAFIVPWWREDLLVIAEK